MVPSKDNVEDIEIDYEGKVDGPRIRKINVTNKTTSSISIEVETANAEGATYRYYYKKEGEEEWKKAGEGKENTYTFNGLEENKVYNIKVEIEKDGKTAEGETSSMTGEMPTGAVQFSPVEWENGKASTVITTNEEGYTLQYQIGGIAEGSWKDTTSGSTIGDLEYGVTVYGRLYDGTNGSKTGSIDVEDKIKPTVVVTEGTITTKSIVVNVEAVDNESGMKGTPTYTYYIKKTGEADSAYKAKATDITEASYTFTGLTQKTGYDIKVEVKEDKAGNVGIGKLLNKETGEIGGATGGLIEGNIIASSPTWSNGQASITLSTSTSLTIQYQVGGIAEENWTPGTEVTGLQHGQTVYARLTDGINYGDEASVDILDKQAPTVTVTKGEVTTKSITVSVSSSDEQWGMPSTPIYSYYIKKSTDGIYPTEASYTGENTSYTFNNLNQTTNYDIQVTVQDKAENTGTGTLLNQLTDTIGGATGGLIEGNIIASTPKWSNGKASITLSTSTGLTIQYQVGGIEEGNWTPGTEVTGLQHGQTVYARLTDGTNYGDEASVDIIDGKKPNAPTITLSGTVGTNGWYKSNVTVTIKAGSDGESGANKVRYKVTGAQTVAQTTTGAGITSKSITISTEGTSIVTAYTIDKAGNVSSAATKTINKDVIAPTANITVGTMTENSIQVTVTASDTTSGLATSGTYKYYLNSETSPRATSTSNTYTFSGLAENTSYTLKVVVTDKAGNSVTTTKTAKTEVYETILEAFNKGTVKIGDYVAYQPSGSNSYTILGTQSGFTNRSDNVVNQTIERDSLNWRVFDVKNGKIRLISEAATNSKVGLAGANGYNNLVYILNKTCAVLYSGNNATAASINNEDIYDKINTNTWDYTQSQYYGRIYNTKEYSYPNILKQEANQPINNYSGSLKQSEQSSIVTGYTTGTSLRIKVTLWETQFSDNALNVNNYKNSKYFEIIQGAMNGTNRTAWLASRGVSYQGGTGFFKANLLYSGGYDTQTLYNTVNQSREKSYSMRPIVTLDSSVKIVTSDAANVEVQQQKHGK